MPPSKAVVLLSGGLDSTTALAMAASQGRSVYALTVNYGQRHRKEVGAARKVAKHFGVAEHTVLRLDLTAFGGSALTDDAVRVPERRAPEEIGGDIPPTYVPARNTILLSLALAYAEARDADEIVIAANAVDYSGYPDCRPAYFAAFQEAARAGTRRGAEGRPIHVRAPLLRMSKADIVRKGQALGVPFRLTWSCYHGRAKACGVCDSCLLRLRAFHEARLRDPIAYEAQPGP